MTAWRWTTQATDARAAIGLVGDTNIQGRDDPATAFAHVAGTLAEFDAMVGQWECPLVETPEPGRDITFKPRWTHSTPDMATPLLAGNFKAVSCASNVAYPPSAALSTRRHLATLGIASAGTGADRAEARAPARFEIRGQRVALLSYTSVFWPIEQPATETSPGVATIKAHTGYMPGRRALEMPGAAPEIRTWADPEELAELQSDIAAAKAEADLVILACHWGVSSQEEITAYQREIARAAVAAGAGLVYGTHPHVIQGIEMLGGVPVFYSLGNFAFDWEKMRGRHLHGLLARCIVDDGRIVEASFVPVRRGADNCVAILDPTAPEGAAVVERTADLSRELGTRLEVVGQEVRLL
jgi:poly-gamma-glutamate synthesis protein (capsule biosynthesis protein)